MNPLKLKIFGWLVKKGKMLFGIPLDQFRADLNHDSHLDNLDLMLFKELKEF